MNGEQHDFYDNNNGNSNGNNNGEQHDFYDSGSSDEQHDFFDVSNGEQHDFYDSNTTNAIIIIIILPMQCL